MIFSMPEHSNIEHSSLLYSKFIKTFGHATPIATKTDHLRLGNETAAAQQSQL